MEVGGCEGGSDVGRPGVEDDARFAAEVVVGGDIEEGWGVLLESDDHVADGGFVEAEGLGEDEVLGHFDGR